jgi:hypothetical protein
LLAAVRLLNGRGVRIRHGGFRLATRTPPRRLNPRHAGISPAGSDAFLTAQFEPPPRVPYRAPAFARDRVGAPGPEPGAWVRSQTCKVRVSLMAAILPPLAQALIFSLSSAANSTTARRPLAIAAIKRWLQFQGLRTPTSITSMTVRTIWCTR